MNDHDLAQEVLSAFIGDTPQRLETLRECVRVGDILRVRAEAHTLKGSAQNAACPSLAAAARKLEQVAQGDNIRLMAELLHEIEKQFAALKDLQGQRQPGYF
ncbi:Hpt domain-containing protein [Desulfonatronum parangueonense]